MLRWAIGTALRRARLEQGRTLRDVAEAAGVSLPYLSEIERGRKEASSEVLASVCRALGLSLVDLLDRARAELTRLSALSGSALGRIVRPGRPRTRRLVECSRFPSTTHSSSTSS
jgi:transcriptional regulator with XRE-family HTH domain